MALTKTTKKATKKATKKVVTNKTTKKATKKAATTAKSTKKVGSSSVKSHLSKLKEMYKKAEGHGKMPIGTWDARVKEFKIVEKNSTLRAVWILKGLDAGQESTNFYIGCGLETEAQLGFLKSIFKSFEVDPPKDILQVESIANSDTVGLDVQLSVTENGEYRNCEIVKILGDGSDTTQYEEPATTPLAIVEEPDDTAGFSLQEKVEVEIDGAMYPGKITDFKDGKAHVEFDDGDSADIPVADLNSLEGGQVEEPIAEVINEGHNIGDVVTVKIEGEMYPGKITQFEDGKAHVLFDDGDKSLVELNELVGSTEAAPDTSAAPTTSGADEYSEADINGLDEDALESICDRHDLNMDIDEFKTLKEQRAEVIKCLGDEGRLTQ